MTLDPSREFEDIYDRMGQLMNMAVGSLGPVAVPDLPWAPAADVAETDDAYMVRVELPGDESHRHHRECRGDLDEPVRHSPSSSR